MGTPATVVLIEDPRDAQTGARVVTGYSQPAHGQVTLIGPRAIYTPTPGYAGSDQFRYTITDASGQSTTATAQVEVAAAVASCSITITAPSPAMIGPALHLTATASCNVGTPQIQWQHRVGTSGTFATFKDFSTDKSADFTTLGQALGSHQFRARVRAQGTTTTFTSNTATTSLIANTTPCTAVALDTPATGAVFGVNQAVALHATATCPAGVVPEFQYLAMQPTDAGFTALPGTFPAGTSYTPPQAGTWLLEAGVRASGSSSAFLTSRSINVAVSHVPVAVDDALVLDQDTTATVNVLSNDADPDGDPLTATITTPPSAGTASIAAGVVTYHPAAGYHGTDVIGYTVSDGQNNTASATVHVTVNALDNPPSAHHDFLTVAENTSGSIDVTANDTDPDGDPLTVVGFSQPSSGTASFAGNVATYTPAPNFVGSDEFEYTVSDGRGKTSTASVFLTVTAVATDRPPVASDDTLITPEDTEGGVNLLGNDSDPDGDPLTVVSYTQPANGTVSVVAGLASYIPAPDYNGPDAFTYTIADPSGLTATATVHITVVPVNDPPVASPDAATLDEDTSATIDVVANDSDIDHDPLTVTAVTQPANGTAAIVDATHVSYTPAPNYNGQDSFSYTISDGAGGTATATVSLTINPVNDPPVASPDAATALEDGSVTIDVVANDSDVDHDPLHIIAITQPANGVATIVDATHVSYTPAPRFHSTDAFSYTIADPSGATATASVTVSVTHVNHPPTANPDAATLDEDTAVTVDVVANDLDVDGDALAVIAITQPANGIATISDAHHVQYIPAPNYNGPDALTYTISDGAGGTATAQLALTVTPVNDPPVAVNDALTLDEDTSATLDVVANDSDVDHDTLAVVSVTQPRNGTAAVTGLHQVSYTPAHDFNGTDSFSYTIDDGHGGQATAQVAVTINPVNDPPVAVNDAVTLDEDTSATVDVIANDTDVDGDALTVSAVTQPANGTAAVVDAHHVSYTPAHDYNGTDSFSYTVIDGHGGQATGQVAVTVNPVNDPPVASAGVLNTFDDTPATATLIASDVDHDPLSFSISAIPTHGTLGPVAGNRVTYTPAAGYVGPDAFAFTVSDGQATSSATIQVTVTRSVCGNGIREGVHEECDDGNATPGDGCESTCKLTCGSGTGADRDAVDPATGRCFVAYDGVQHSYQDAAAMCVAIGGHLPTIASAGENAAAFAAVRGGDTPWLGGDDIAVEGTFGWLTGEPFGYSHFQTGKPDNAGNADCLRYVADGTWTDAACAAGGATGTLCELELATATPVFATGGGGTRALAIADLNGDGFSDIAAVNPANNTVGVLLGDGAGGFAAPVSFATGAGPAAIATGDFDGDGKIDLAVVNATASTVGILRGNGSGGFTAGASVAIASGATAITAADVDGDGVLDLVVAATATVQVLRGNGAGGFSVLGGGVALTAAPAAIAAGDFNHDGKIDLAVTTPLAVLILSATGGGAFGLPVTLAVTTGARGIAVRDLDGDGNADLAVATSTGISVWFGSGSGLGAPVSLTAAGAQFVAAGDFDGDGSTDLVAVTANFATLFHGAGRAFTQAGPVVTTGGGGASFLVAANLNGDAATDLVVANATTSTAGIVLGGTGGLNGARALPAGTASTSTVVGDFNEDGLPDLAVIDPPSSKVFLFLQNAAGALVPGTTISLAAGVNPTYAVTADFNGDHHLDLAVINVSSNGVNVLLGTGTGTFAAPINSAAGTLPQRPVVVDFDGDGAPDLVIPSATNNTLAVLLNAGGGRFGKKPTVQLSGGLAAVVAGDFDGDGKKDLAAVSTGEATVKLVLGHGDGTFGAPTAFPIAAGGQSLAAADLDGDGKLDLAVTCTATNSVSFLSGTGTGSFAPAISLPVGGQPSSVVAVDLDGDGKLDLVVGNAATSDVTVLHGSGAGGFGASSLAVGGPTGWVTVTDLDHDGHLDIVASSASSVATLLYSPR